MLFTFPSRYWFTIGLSVVFSLAGWCRLLQTGFLRSRLTQDTANYLINFVYGTFTLFGIIFQIISTIYYFRISQSYNPKYAVTYLVWASSRSLATTWEITIVFFSSGYLDVSVLRVRLLLRISSLQLDGLPHSDIYGSKVICTSP